MTVTAAYVSIHDERFEKLAKHPFDLFTMLHETVDQVSVRWGKHPSRIVVSPILHAHMVRGYVAPLTAKPDPSQTRVLLFEGIPVEANESLRPMDYEVEVEV